MLINNNAGIFGPSGDEQGPLKGEGISCAVQGWGVSTRDLMPGSQEQQQGRTAPLPPLLCRRP